MFGAALFRRPEIALQDAEMIEFAPGILFASEAASAAEQDLVLELPRGNAIARSPQGDVAIQGSVERPTASGSPRFARDDGGSAPSPSPSLGHYERPENPPQRLEKVDSAPGIAPDPQFSTVASGWSMLRDATRCVALQHEGRAFPRVAPARDRRPEIPPQGLEKVDSAPGFGWLDYAASQSGGARGVRLPFPSPSGAGPPKVRAILDGVMAF